MGNRRNKRKKSIDSVDNENRKAGRIGRSPSGARVCTVRQALCDANSVLYENDSCMNLFELFETQSTTEIDFNTSEIFTPPIDKMATNVTSKQEPSNSDIMQALTAISGQLSQMDTRLKKIGSLRR